MRLYAFAVLGAVGMLGGGAAGQARFFQVDVDQYFDPTIGLTRDGRVLVTSNDGGPGTAYRWTVEEGRVRLPGGAHLAQSVSDDGSVIAGCYQSRGDFDFCMWVDGAFTDLARPEGTYGYSEALVTGDGSTIWLRAVADSGSKLWRWTDSTGYEFVGGDPGSSPRAVSRDGSVVVGLVYTPRERPFYWTAGSGFSSFEDLPPEGRGWASGVSSDGSMIVGEATTDWEQRPDREAFAWTEASGLVWLGDASGGRHRSAAMDVSADGRVIVGEVSVDGTSRPQAGIWDPDHGLRDLNELLPRLGADISGLLELSSAVQVSDDGRVIAGRGVYAASRPWVAILCPPDCDEEGHLNINDFTCFQYKWRTRTSYGDYNRDGRWTINDFLAFQADWRRGCD